MIQFFLGGAPPVFAVTTSGGCVVGSAIAQPSILFSATMSGGPVVGEDDTPSANFTESTSGGPVVGETAQGFFDFSRSTSGGLVVGEQTENPTAAFTPSTSGGPIAGGHLTQPTIFFTATTSGGPVLSETVQAGGSVLVVGIGGGPIVGSTIDQAVIGFARPSSGGVVVGETVSPSNAFIGTSTAGILVGETGQGLYDVAAQTTGGGCVVGSLFTPAVSGFTALSTGGVVVGSQDTPVLVFAAMATGGGILIGSSTHGFPPSGSYHIYENHGIGDAVDYDFAVETTAQTTWTTPSLPYPGDYSFHVRAFWNYDLDEEHNLDARVRIVLDATGADVTNRPAAPTGLAAQAIKGGQVRLSWLYKTPSGRSAPSKFNVYSGTPGVSYASVKMMIAYGSDGRYFAVATGLVNGSTYQFVVRAANSTAEEPNTNVVTATADSSGPNPPQDLVAIAI